MSSSTLPPTSHLPSPPPPPPPLAPTHLQGEGQVPVVQDHHRHDLVSQQLIDEAVVKGHAALIDLGGCGGVCGRGWVGGWEGASKSAGGMQKGMVGTGCDFATVKFASGFVAGCRCGGVCAFISPLASSTPPPHPTPPRPTPAPPQHILPHPNTHLAAPCGDEAAPGQGQLVVLDPHLLHQRHILLVPAQGWSKSKSKSKHRSSTVRAEFGRGKGLRSLLCPAHACMLSPHPVLQECP